MKKTGTIILILFYILFIQCYSCSRLILGKGFTIEKETEWHELSDAEDDLFAFEFSCENKSIKLKKINKTNWVFIGIAFTPVIPVFKLWKSPDNFYFDIEITSSDSLLYIEPPKIAFKINENNNLTYPMDAYHCQSNIKKFGEENLYHWDIRLSLDKHIATYLYKFDLDIDTVKTIDVIFTEEYQNCNISNLKYILDKTWVYQPIFIPGD